MSNFYTDNTNNVHYNAIINNPSGSGVLVPMEFEQNHNQAVILDPTKYTLCVERFNIPGNALPLFFFKDGKYSVTLSFGGDDYRTDLVYVPIASPSFDPGSQPVYYFTQMVTAFNTAFVASFDALKLAHPVGTPDHPPVLIYNSVTQLFSFVVPRTYDPTGGPTIEVYLNYDSAILFENIQFFSLSRNDPNGKDSRLIVENLYNNYYPVATDPTVNFVGASGTYPAYQFTSLFPYFRQWNQLKSIVITTQSIPCRREIVALDGSDQSSYINMLTDFTPQINSTADILSTFYFYPQGPYRLIDLVSQVPLYRFDFKIYWSSFDGKLYQMYVTPGNEVNIKFLFMKKTAMNYVNAGAV
jgi:hypothetical protein